MGASQGTSVTSTETVQRRTVPDTVVATQAKPQICSLCSSQYQRNRPSVCICSHCSLPLCSDCLTDHISDLPQNVAQLSEQYLEVEQLYAEKHTMVYQEALEWTENVKQFFKAYQSDLLEAHQTTILGIEQAKQDAKIFLKNVYSNLQVIRADIETLAAETIYQPSRMEALFTQLNEIQAKLETYVALRCDELEIVTPKYTLKFQCIPTPTTDSNSSPASKISQKQERTKKKQDNRHNSHPYKRHSASARQTNRSSNNHDTEFE